MDQKDNLMQEIKTFCDPIMIEFSKKVLRFDNKFNDFKSKMLIIKIFKNIDP